jgi:prefoldin alpha subunit
MADDKSSDERLVQERILAYRQLEERMDALVRQQASFASKAAEVSSTLAAIGEVAAGRGDAMVPLGTAVYAKGRIDTAAKLLVEIGSDVAVERTPAEARAILEARRKDLEQAVEVLQKDIQTVAGMLQGIEAEMQSMMRSRKQ